MHSHRSSAPQAKLELHVVPVLLGGGPRLIDNPVDAEVQLEQLGV